MKLLKRKILFSLASQVDFFSQAEGFEYQSYNHIYQSLPRFKKSSIRDAVLQLVQSAELDKIIRNNTPLFRLTGRGRDRLLSFFPISIGQKKVWDRIWRIAILSSRFKVQGSRLRQLRRGLIKLGFKQFSRGIYITPLAITEKLKDYLLKNNLASQVTIIESRRLIMADDKQLAKQIWQLDSLVLDYQKLISNINKLLTKLAKQKSLSNKDKNSFALILDHYFSLLSQDPGLPKKLLPHDWPQNRAKESYLKLVEKIKTAKPAKT